MFEFSMFVFICTANWFLKTASLDGSCLEQKEKEQRKRIELVLIVDVGKFSMNQIDRYVYEIPTKTEQLCWNLANLKIEMSIKKQTTSAVQTENCKQDCSTVKVI